MRAAKFPHQFPQTLQYHVERKTGRVRMRSLYRTTSLLDSPRFSSRKRRLRTNFSFRGIANVIRRAYTRAAYRRENAPK